MRAIPISNLVRNSEVLKLAPVWTRMLACDNEMEPSSSRQNTPAYRIYGHERYALVGEALFDRARRHLVAALNRIKLCPFLSLCLCIVAATAAIIVATVTCAVVSPWKGERIGEDKRISPVVAKKCSSLHTRPQLYWA
uniref:Uncharacterized protein n=1 Tax=Anopheles maculatus TaxID=74869 RepID=A0A182T4C6_9DIPT